MKHVFMTLMLSAAASTFSYAQYVPATVYGTSLDSTDPVNGIYNVGIDSRSGEIHTIYTNMTTVMVSDYHFSGTRRYFWQKSDSSGSYPLPSGAYDPDVTLIDGVTNNAWAIIVYYLPSMGGYCMSFSRVIGSSMLAPTAPVLIQAYTPVSSKRPYINVDADNKGRYAVIFEMADGIKCGTGTMGAGFTPPPLPGNFTNYSGLIEPDVAVNFITTAPTSTVKIIALTNNRDGYVLHGRAMDGTPGYAYASLLNLHHLYNPRIASTQASSQDYAFVMKREVSGSGLHNILFSTYNPTDGFSGLKTANNGTLPTFPTAINSYNNTLPSITYTGSGSNELISIGWHTAFLPGPPYSIANTMVGIDFKPLSLASITPDQYQDVSIGNVDNVSTIGLSGRYVYWGAKTALYARGASASIPNMLVWKFKNFMAGSWRITDEKTDLTSSVELSPNPASNQVLLTIPDNELRQYEIYNGLGLQMTKGNAAGKVSIDIQNWPAGSYFIRIMNPLTRQSLNKQFVKL